MYTSLQSDPMWEEQAWEDWSEEERADATEDYESGSIENPIALYFRDMARRAPLILTDQARLAREIQRCQKRIIRLFTDIPLATDDIAVLKERIKNNGEATGNVIDVDADLVEQILFQLKQVNGGSRNDRRVRTILDQIHLWVGRLRVFCDRMVESNLRLVVSTSKHYRNRGIPFVDLIQEGNIGLMKAVARFNPNKGFRFSTYAIWWIRQVIQRAIEEKGRTIRMPSYMIEALGRYRRVMNDRERPGGVHPEEAMEKANVSRSQWEFLQNPVEEPVSMDTPMPSGSSKVVDMLPDRHTPSPWEVAARKELTGRLQETLKVLSSKEEIVVRQRFGIDDGKDRTLEEIGKQLGISRERVRQIEKRALGKLKDELGGLKELCESV